VNPAAPAGFSGSKVPKEDPAGPEFWERRYRERVTPWDAGRSPAEVQALIAGLAPHRRVLIPGCGSAYEARAFAEAGHDVIAIDFSEAALAAARRVLGEWQTVLRQADFFSADLGVPFDLVYERAFLCALPRRLWPAYVARVAEVLRPGGRLAGYFYWSEGERGPPFGLRPGELETLLAGTFARIADVAVQESIPVFAGKERWQVWVRAG
jgi:thiopurine S-methyltransferase